ncbi:MAG: hypothetical protein UY92_C0007G0020 [Candidatus Magasanikbacteria bacterium GW2011_GWA2_56_11]|uniref:N-acylneuraminate cytidylyltransferase n=1 Tax=Candidatus Magasanikbacteria bacterium GW2011_GWA2_56_11 TaxID=1619044 RepID=A0A0G1YGL6_9BACT|nr:MAG: hypothetical protein UY92_C0007G0020 [Candidatus Magasanikbacteria bacterium GW2011_GWA2_56_11]
MYKEKRVLGIITARGGSKGIPRKNIKDLAGRPLIAHTIEAAKQSAYLTRCVVSTDDPEIAAVARSWGADVPFMRPAELAGDRSTSLEVVRHALGELCQSGDAYDYVMILQPTSPLRTTADIDACIAKIVDTGADSVMSMMELVDFSLKKLKRLEGDLILPLAEEEGSASSRRQSLVPLYKRNGAIYLTRVSLLEQGDMFGQVSRAHLMPPERSVDINEPIDFLLAEFYLRHQSS